MKREIRNPTKLIAPYERYTDIWDILVKNGHTNLNEVVVGINMNTDNPTRWIFDLDFLKARCFEEMINRAIPDEEWLFKFVHAMQHPEENGYIDVALKAHIKQYCKAVPFDRLRH